MRVGGRIVSLGAIGEMAAMETGQIHGWREYPRVPVRELTFGGFLTYNHFDKLLGAALALGQLLAEGKLKSAETIVRGGFEQRADCVDRLHASQRFGRLILAVE